MRALGRDLAAVCDESLDSGGTTLTAGGTVSYQGAILDLGQFRDRSFPKQLFSVGHVVGGSVNVAAGETFSIEVIWNVADNGSMTNPTEVVRKTIFATNGLTTSEAVNGCGAIGTDQLGESDDYAQVTVNAVFSAGATDAWTAIHSTVAGFEDLTHQGT